jgi:hypothetical protein
MQQLQQLPNCHEGLCLEPQLLFRELAALPPSSGARTKSIEDSVWTNGTCRELKKYFFLNL